MGRRWLLALGLCLLITRTQAQFGGEEDEEEDEEEEEEEWSSEDETAEEKLQRKNIKQDSNLTVDKLIAKYGYEAEVHHVTTEDGYILTMHRIRNQNAQPFLLQHGLVDSSAGFVVMGPNVSLGYLLADHKYDVWLGNARGNRYSRNHTTLDPDESKFWDFSWHEIGMYDLPAMIDYILKSTGFKKLQYAGHSQGCTAFFVMCSMRPAYNEKVISMQAMAPAVYAKETSGHPYIRAISLYFNSLVGSAITEMFNGEFRFLCRMTEETERLCIEAVFGIVGRNWNEFNRKMFPVVLGHYPAGVAAKQVKHFIQIIKTGRFAPYSYSSNKNMVLYREHLPPRYNLSLVTVPTFVYYSTNDLLCHPSDVESMCDDLGNVTGKYLVPMKDFNHMDFLWAIDVRKQLYNRMLQVLGKRPQGKDAEGEEFSTRNVERSRTHRRGRGRASW
ncbi:lipase 1 [Drosophila sulfurigaster albostrigata]|uniref:lipase 1 n=1 Tax=Drosophila sulfurigaster albostrigata TaxID=89887 RepID=UPI002D219FA5|nr:lipase 1 [Drosophila sulfurigaster albostrigata]